MQNSGLSDIDLLYFFSSPLEMFCLSKRAKMQNGGLSDIDLLYFVPLPLEIFAYPRGLRCTMVDFLT